jgi:hypothetical protein
MATIRSGSALDVAAPDVVADDDDDAQPEFSIAAAAASSHTPTNRFETRIDELL